VVQVKVLFPFAQAIRLPLTEGGPEDETSPTLSTVVSELQYGKATLCSYALTINGGVLPQLTATQLPAVAAGVPPVTIHWMFPLPEAQYCTVEPPHTTLLPVITGAEGGATTVIMVNAESLQD
jgi:hypothetical protein